MENKPVDYTGGRTFWQFMTMSIGKIFTMIFIHGVCGYGLYLLFFSDISTFDSTWGYFAALGIITVVLLVYWFGSYKDYKLLKKGISK